MRILVISDSHGRRTELERVIEKYNDAKHIFFLGDNTRDIVAVSEFYPDRSFHIVSGNCDIGSAYPEESSETVGGVTVFYCHGHTASVKQGLSVMLVKTERIGAKIGLFGHTHCSSIDYMNGIFLVNPGSIARPRDGGASVALIDITDKGILPTIIKGDNL